MDNQPLQGRELGEGMGCNGAFDVLHAGNPDATMTPSDTVWFDHDSLADIIFDKQYPKFGS